MSCNRKNFESCFPSLIPLCFAGTKQKPWIPSISSVYCKVLWLSTTVTSLGMMPSNRMMWEKKRKNHSNDTMQTTPVWLLIRNTNISSTGKRKNNHFISILWQRGNTYCAAAQEIRKKKHRMACSVQPVSCLWDRLSYLFFVLLILFFLIFFLPKLFYTVCTDRSNNDLSISLTSLLLLLLKLTALASSTARITPETKAKFKSYDNPQPPTAPNPSVGLASFC